MFHDFDQRFFNGKLISNGVEIDWSPKMTLCAGLCRWSPNNLSCSIKLSKPLLQLRSRRDLVETLIHEMIHALLFVIRDSDNRESHGPKFQEHMFRINKETNLSISIYHTFHDEVKHYQTHVWRCKGICRNRAPYFGWVKRSMNRKPGAYDSWWSQHQQACGGEFEKISEPEGFNAKKQKKSTKENQTTTNVKDIKDFFTPTKSTNQLNDQNINNNNGNQTKIVSFDDLNKAIKKEDNQEDNFNIPKNIVPFSGEGKILGNGSTQNPLPGKSILLQKFGNNSIQKKSEPISSTITSSMVTNSILNSNNQLAKIENSNKSSINHFDTSLNENSANKRQKLDITITLTDDEDAEFSWLNDLTDDQLLRISQNDCIVIDD